MVSQTSGNRRSAQHPMDATVSDPEFEAQAVVMSTEVVDTADQIHPRLEGFNLASQSTTPSDEAGQPLAESGVQPLDEGGVDRAAI